MRVVNMNRDRFTVAIDRRTPFGNRYRVGQMCSRERAVLRFEIEARRNPALLELIRALPADAVLGCHCKPLACHGDVIVKIWKEMHRK